MGIPHLIPHYMRDTMLYLSDHATLKLQQSSSDIVGIEEPFRLSLLRVQVCSTLF